MKNRAASGKRKEEEHTVCYNPLKPACPEALMCEQAAVAEFGNMPCCSTRRSSTVLRYVSG